MRFGHLLRAALFLPLILGLMAVAPANGDGNLKKVKHVVVIMQENHSFDNYFGALAYAPGSPYHSGLFGCRNGDHSCVDGLACVPDNNGGLHCYNANRDDDGSLVTVFHDSRRCADPDLDHSWLETHQEINFLQPNSTLRFPLSDGFVRVNDKTEQIDNGVENPTDDQTMGFYTQNELPFYYNLASQFAISDRHFASLLGPTFPNRAYLMAATSFGHLTTSDTFPPAGGYKPVNGTIFDLLERNNVSWADYFQDAPQGGSFRPFGATGIDPHFFPLAVLLQQAAGEPNLPALPSVSFVDPSFGLFGRANENDEHPPTDIQRGQAYVSTVVNALRNGPYWQDTVIFITYDEHGGYFDHVAPPAAQQESSRTPDGIFPGQCADLSNAPLSLQPGGGAECAQNPLSATDTTVNDAAALCPQLASDPNGSYPADCAAFDQLGVRVPFMAVSPFSKPHYVSHTAGDHTSILAFIEKRFLSTDLSTGDDGAGSTVVTRAFLTLRDKHADTMEDLFDFEGSPSLNTVIPIALPPAQDCTPK
ncbi:MAG TPA: alkaline phosphatase family protein [Candidatus Sulfotelmatobacter sp.]|jgi:phospholipase C|nr:alkaline phosphatase family protein [Candidatus Sulfotelmatobacter sp.]